MELWIAGAEYGVPKILYLCIIKLFFVLLDDACRASAAGTRRLAGPLFSPFCSFFAVALLRTASRLLDLNPIRPRVETLQSRFRWGGGKGSYK